MTDDELRALFECLRHDAAELRRDNGALRQENAAAHEQTRRHFDVVIEKIDNKMDAVGESVAALDEKFERKNR